MTRHHLTILIFALVIACAKDEDAADEGASAPADSGEAADDAAPTDESTSAEDSAATGESSYTGADIDALWDCVDPMIVEARPLAGPGYDAEMGGLVEPLEDEYIVATTKIIVHEEKQAEFLEVSGTVAEQLEATRGMVAYGLAFEPTCTFFRTLSVYRTQEDMMGFVYSDAHVEAIGRYGEFAVTAKTTAWVLPAEEFPPTWAMADEHLAEIEPF